MNKKVEPFEALCACNWVGLGPWKAKKLVLYLMMIAAKSKSCCAGWARIFVCTLLLVEALQALTGKGAEPVILGSPSVSADSFDP